MFKKEKVIDGVVQRDFVVDAGGESVPAVIYAREGASGPRPLILMGHGGSQHKKTEGIRLRAIHYAQQRDWATLAIDAPGHGDRISRAEAEQNMVEVGRRVSGEVAAPMDDTLIKRMLQRAEQAKAEWRHALDVALDLDFVGGTSQVGYWGVSMGTMIGVPFVAAEPRVRCAVFGLAGARPGLGDIESAAARITIPVQFVFQWDDAVAPRDNGIALFNAFGSKEKTMHINPGGHMYIPDFESAAWLAFFARHLADN